MQLFIYLRLLCTVAQKKYMDFVSLNNISVQVNKLNGLSLKKIASTPGFSVTAMKDELFANLHYLLYAE